MLDLHHEYKTTLWFQTSFQYTMASCILDIDFMSASIRFFVPQQLTLRPLFASHACR